MILVKSRHSSWQKGELLAISQEEGIAKSPFLNREPLVLNGVCYQPFRRTLLSNDHLRVGGSCKGAQLLLT